MVWALLAGCSGLAPVGLPQGGDKDPDAGETDVGAPQDTFPDDSGDTGGLVTDTDDTDAGDTADDSDSGPTCRQGTARPNQARYVLVSHPNDDTGAKADTWEVLRLDTDGTLSTTTRTFTMGRGYGGSIAFSPDGSLAAAVQDDGTLGIVTLSAAGVPSVVYAAFNDNGAGGALYAKHVLFDPNGIRLWVVDGNWVNNGGGVYAIDLDCRTGAPTPRGLVMESKLGTHLLPLPSGKHLLVAKEAMASGPGKQVHVVDLAVPSVLSSAALWADDEAIIGGATLAGDGTYVLAGDYSAFSSIDNRIGVARVQGKTVSPVQVLPDILDPIAIAAWGQSTLVASGFGDALLAVDYAPGALPFANPAELATTGGPSLLPGAVAVGAAPGGDGWMLVAELTSVRRLRATAAGVITDLGPFEFGEGLEDIVGSVGLQP